MAVRVRVPLAALTFDFSLGHSPIKHCLAMNIFSPLQIPGKSFSLLQFVFIALCIVTLSSCGVESGHFRMSGRFLNMDQGEFYVYGPEGGIDGIDTIHVQGGRFTFERPLEREAVLMLVFPNFSEQPIFAQPGKSVEIKADASHMKEMEVSGTKANEMMTKFRKQTANSSPPETVKAAEEFITSHPESSVGMFLLRKYFIQTLKPDYVKAAALSAKMLEKQPKNGSLIVLQKQLSQLSAATVGKQLPTFTAKDINGHTVSDKDLGDDLAIIYVWSSWNYESQDGQRQLKRRARKSGGKLRLMSICIDADPKKCQEILDRDTINWPSVFDGKLFEGATLKRLGLWNVPDNLVIQRHRIIARSLTSQELYNKLDELLK